MDPEKQRAARRAARMVFGKGFPYFPHSARWSSSGMMMINTMMKLINAIPSVEPGCERSTALGVGLGVGLEARAVALERIALGVALGL